MGELEAARDRHLMGPERASAVVPAASREATAYHEAGHALVAALTPGARPVHRVTVVPRGHALGMVAQLPEDGAEYRGTSRRWGRGGVGPVGGRGRGGGRGGRGWGGVAGWRCAVVM